MKNMLKKYTNADKILVLNWWADTEYIKPIPKDENLFIKKGLDYGSVLGLAG